jgi:HAE1 family hydrophobic/amphiphilic exporter-1
MQSPDKDEIYAAAQKLELAVAKMPGLQDVTSNLQIQTPQVNVTIDRDKAAALQVNAQQISPFQTACRFADDTVKR